MVHTETIVVLSDLPSDSALVLLGVDDKAHVIQCHVVESVLPGLLTRLTLATFLGLLLQRLHINPDLPAARIQDHGLAVGKALPHCLRPLKFLVLWGHPCALVHSQIELYV
jgi:hypothetical protein